MRPALGSPQAELGAPGGGLRVRTCVDKRQSRSVPLGSAGHVGCRLCPQQPLTLPEVALGRSESPRKWRPRAGSPWDRGESHHPRAPTGQSAALLGGLDWGLPQATWGQTEGRPSSQLAAGGLAECPLCAYVPRFLFPVILWWTLALFSFTFGLGE